jgi:multiple antibiotic resistance protein
MSDWLKSLVSTFIPLFIVMDAFGNLPYVIEVTEGLPSNQQHRIIHTATLTAALIGLVFLFFGRLILTAMSISVGYFAIACGIVLMVFSIRFLLTGQSVEMVHDKLLAISPLGTPLLAGPAIITTLLLLSLQYAIYIVLISFALNLILAWVILHAKDKIMGFMGSGGLKAIGNVFNLLLAAIAASMVLRGLTLLGVIK